MYLIPALVCMTCGRHQPHRYSAVIVEVAQALPPETVMESFPCADRRCTDVGGERSIVYVTAGQLRHAIPVAALRRARRNDRRCNR